MTRSEEFGRAQRNEVVSALFTALARLLEWDVTCDWDFGWKHGVEMEEVMMAARAVSFALDALKAREEMADLRRERPW